MKFHGFEIVEDEMKVEENETEVDFFNEITSPGTQVIFRGRVDRDRDGGSLIIEPLYRVRAIEPR